MVDPHSDTQYTCEILDGGDEPIVSSDNLLFFTFFFLLLTDL
jgi:hypothetical protein